MEEVDVKHLIFVFCQLVFLELERVLSHVEIL
jgi:hypothetical protein